MCLIKNFNRALPLPFSRGFTIIELMMALVIMAILASTAVPIYRDYSVRAKVAEAYGVVSALKLSVEDDYISSGHKFKNGTNSTNCGTFSLACTEDDVGGTAIVTKYVASTFIGPEGVIEVTLNANVISELGTNTKFRFVPMTRVPTISADGVVTAYNTVGGADSGVISWKCLSGAFSGVSGVVDEAGTDMVEPLASNGVAAKYAPGECKS